MDKTLHELSSLLSRSTGVKARDVLRGLVDMDQFERDIKTLSKRVSAGAVAQEVEGELSEAEAEAAEEGSAEEDGPEAQEYSEDDEYSGEDTDGEGELSDGEVDEMDPKRQLEMLMEPVEDDGEGDDLDGDDLGVSDFEDDLSDGGHGDKADQKRQLSLSSDESDTDVLDSVHHQLSSYQQKKRRLAKEIAELERENVTAVSEKQWTMSGEIRAAQRPENSLLEEQVIDFEHATKALPEITEAVTETHEQVIRNRIRERAFDDAPLRVLVDGGSVEKGGEGRKKKLDDAIKSERNSLAQVYEDKVLREAGVEVEAKGKQQVLYAELDRLYARVCATLDGMSGVRSTLSYA